ncbi:AzlC family ABC transporter permease [Corynebacterium uterequi]|uniref:Putative branched-chain amino acid permease (Azaleucine resistance) n=1 Tax=Corynebacterium uterequi TaxID=1072256 RepID=A0A0G3HJS8_9CORY|nr:AzlC family ABC transporter permease [Corynebacterium uterequi]AKK12178.1 putative branched-chain amino acid permease (azaleucine resistance) [Corynebacterium uterequi]
MAGATSTTLREAARGVRDVWAVGLGLIPLGVAFGLLVVQMGFAWWWAPIFSIIIYAGSMEYLALGLVTGGASWVTAAVTGLLVNFRHVFYGLTYPRHRIRRRWARAYATYAITDEVYAVTARFGADGLDDDGLPVSSMRLLTITAVAQALWVSSGILGALGGSLADIPWAGLEFALTALFVVLALDAFLSSRDLSLPVIALGCGLFAAVVAPGHLLIVALSAYFGIHVLRFLSPRFDAWLTTPLGGGR